MKYYLHIKMWLKKGNDKMLLKNYPLQAKLLKEFVKDLNKGDTLNWLKSQFDWNLSKEVRGKIKSKLKKEDLMIEFEESKFFEDFITCVDLLYKMLRGMYLNRTSKNIVGGVKFKPLIIDGVIFSQFL